MNYGGMIVFIICVLYIILSTFGMAHYGKRSGKGNWKIWTVFLVTNIIAVNLIIKSMSGSTMTQISEKAVSGELGIEVDILENEGTELAAFDGKNHYYREGKKIFSLEDKKHIVTVPNECRNFSVSEKYVYCAVADGVLQYDKAGKLLQKRKISQGISEIWLYTGQKNLYCYVKDLKGIRYVYSFDLDDVARPGKMSSEILDQTTDYSADGNKMLEEYRAVELPDLWLIVDRSDSKVQWMDKEKALKITGKIAEVAFVDKHEKRLVLTENMVVNYDGKDLYVRDDLLKISGENKWKDYANCITDKYSIVSADVKKNTALVRFISYGDDGRGVNRTGSLAEFEGSGFARIDLSTGKILHKVIKDKEQVLAASDNYYSTFCKGTVKRYQVKDDKCIKESKVNGYKQNKEYTVQTCGNIVFVFVRQQNGDMKLLDVIEI